VLTTNWGVADAVRRWAASFETALAANSHEALRELFVAESYLRDMAALTWDWRQFWGSDSVIDQLLSLGASRPRNLRVARAWPEPVVSEADRNDPLVVAFIDFDTEWGAGIFVLNGVLDAESEFGFKARVLVSRIEDVRGYEPVDSDPNAHRPDGSDESWTDYRARKRGYVDSSPEVLIVGAGHSGLMVAAHLDQMGISTLVVDREKQIGDNWRNRYSSLVLHNPMGQIPFPFLPFPAHMPEYWPKDVVADWLRVYAKYLDLNVWTETELVGGVFEDTKLAWDATLRLADGSTRTLHPKHIVEATGVTGGRPNVPRIEGLDSFKGIVQHSHDFRGAEHYHDTVRSAIVVGVGSSGHDISLALYKHGVKVTLVQRGPIVVVDLETANLAYGAEYFDGVTPTELPDLRRSPGFVQPLRIPNMQAYHRLCKQLDAELLEGLENAGMRLGDGRDDAGWLSEFFHHGGGFYINVGASDVIVQGGIKVVQAEHIERFTEDGARLDDGTVLKADLVVLATGYQNRLVDIRERFGDGVADRVGPVAVTDGEGEWANVYRPTGQRGLWFSGGGIAYVRRGGAVLALLIKAELTGLIPDTVFEKSLHAAADAVPITWERASAL
jgi:cation diffusion facilitator CzcD-associated flavoprotein CzcO